MDYSTIAFTKILFKINMMYSGVNPSATDGFSPQPVRAKAQRII
jgi:hypothetical protein